jgi:hypothetical protein
MLEGRPDAGQRIGDRPPDMGIDREPINVGERRVQPHESQVRVPERQPHRRGREQRIQQRARLGLAHAFSVRRGCVGTARMTRCHLLHCAARFGWNLRQARRPRSARRAPHLARRDPKPASSAASARRSRACRARTRCARLARSVARRPASPGPPAARAPWRIQTSPLRVRLHTRRCPPPEPAAQWPGSNDSTSSRTRVAGPARTSSGAGCRSTRTVPWRPSTR